MVPPDLEGEIVRVSPDGSYTVNDEIAVLKNKQGEHKLTLAQVWPIRQPRPVKERLHGGPAADHGPADHRHHVPHWQGRLPPRVPGPFGAGKTIIQHQLAKWCDADIIVYLGCGERGNEMTQVLEEFAGLHGPPHPAGP